MTASNHDEITRQIATLQDRHDEAPVEREDPPFEVPTERFREIAERARTGTVNSSYVWVRRTPDQFPDPSASSPDYAGGELDIQLTELYGAAWFDRMPDSVYRLILSGKRHRSAILHI